MAYFPTTGLTDPRIGHAEIDLPAIAAGATYTWVHGLNTPSVHPWFIKNIGGNGISPGEPGQFQLLDWRWDYSNPKNAIVIRPDIAIGDSEIRAYVDGWYGFYDAIAPSAPPVISMGSKTSTTITMNATGGSDNVGIKGYNWFLNGVYIWTTFAPTYTFTGLAPSTAYNITCYAIDAANNASPVSNTFPVTTEAVPVTFTHTWVASTKPATIPDFGQQHLGPYTVIASATVQSGDAPTSNSNAYYGGGVVNTPTSSVLHSCTVEIGGAGGGSSLRKAGAAVGGSDAAFTNGVLGIGCGFGDANATQILQKVGGTFTTRASSTTTWQSGDILKLEITVSGGIYTYSIYKNGGTTAVCTWVDNTALHTPGPYGGFGLRAEYASGQYRSPGVRGNLILKDNAA